MPVERAEARAEVAEREEAVARAGEAERDRALAVEQAGQSDVAPQAAEQQTQDAREDVKGAEQQAADAEQRVEQAVARAEVAEREREEAIARAGEAERDRALAVEQARQSDVARQAAEQQTQDAREDVKGAEQRAASDAEQRVELAGMRLRTPSTGLTAPSTQGQDAQSLSASSANSARRARPPSVSGTGRRQRWRPSSGSARSWRRIWRRRSGDSRKLRRLATRRSRRVSRAPAAAADVTNADRVSASLPLGGWRGSEACRLPWLRSLAGRAGRGSLWSDGEAIIAIDPTSGRALGVTRYVRLSDDPAQRASRPVRTSAVTVPTPTLRIARRPKPRPPRSRSVCAGPLAALPGARAARRDPASTR